MLSLTLKVNTVSKVKKKFCGGSENLPYYYNLII